MLTPVMALWPSGSHFTLEDMEAQRGQNSKLRFKNWFENSFPLHDTMTSRTLEVRLLRWLSGEESIYQCRRRGLIPGPGIFSPGGNGNSLLYSCLENSMDRGGLQPMGSQKVGHDWAHTHWKRVNFYISPDPVRPTALALQPWLSWICCGLWPHGLYDLMWESERQVNTFSPLKSRLNSRHSMNPWRSSAVWLSGVAGVRGSGWKHRAGGRAGFNQGSPKVTGDVRLAWVSEDSGPRPGSASLGESPFWAHRPDVGEASWIWTLPTHKRHLGSFKKANIQPPSEIMIQGLRQHTCLHSFLGKESTCKAGDPGSIPGLGRSPGEGSGHLLWDSWLENSMDRGAWQATLHRVTKSHTVSVSQR